MLEVGAEISGFESSVNLGQRARRLRRGSTEAGGNQPGSLRKWENRALTKITKVDASIAGANGEVKGWEERKAS